MEVTWPELEFWIYWPSLVALAIAVAATVIGFISNPWWRGVAIAILAFITLYGIALTNKISTKPERDYAYFYVPNNQTPTPNGKVRLHRRATGPLSSVAVAFARPPRGLLDEYEYAHPSARIPEGTGYAFEIEPGDWHIDVDPLSRKGQVKQRLHIEIKDGIVITIFAQVKRKFGGKDVLCETPKRESIPLCI